MTGERTAVAAPASDQNSEITTKATRSSSRNQRSSLGDSKSGLVGAGSPELANTNASLKPPPPDTKSKYEATGNLRKRGRSATRAKRIQSNEKTKGTRKRGRTSYSSERGGRKVPGGKNARIDTAANMLATLDSRAYHRSLLRDANNINRAILTPMSLPWMHDVAPVVRNIPCDIDEMPEILAADDGTYSPFDNGQFGFGMFAMCQMNKGIEHQQVEDSGDVRTASRRSDDPGVIELSTIMVPPTDGETSSPNEGPVDLSYSDGTEVGEISLQCFELEQARKKRRVERARSFAQTRLVSVKINSTSSRSSVFQNDSRVKVFEAILPAEVQDGRFLSISRAKKIAEKLGSFDCRYRLPPSKSTGKNANRVSVGRTRRMWTSKIPNDQPQRVFFTSLLTGAKLDGGAQKRPRNIRLAIKFNGRYFDDSPAGSDLSREERNSDGFETKPKYFFPSLQCRLDSHKLVQSIIKTQTDKDEAGQAKRIASPAGSSGPPLITPANFDCVPDINGIVSVECTNPGSIRTSSIHDLLNSVAKQDSPLCTICWNPKSRALGKVQECVDCGVLVHPNCCLNPGEFNGSEDDSKKWKCSVCCKKKSKRNSEKRERDSRVSSTRNKRTSRPPVWLKDSLTEVPAKNGQATTKEKKWPAFCDHPKCAVCPYSGGAMSLVPKDKDGNDSECEWVHEICRIWTDFAHSLAEDDSVGDSENQICSLCGGNKNVSASAQPSNMGVVKCAAARCRVYFHPMCALLASKLSKNKSQPIAATKAGNTDVSSLQNSMDKDLDLTTNFTLTAIDCEAASTTTKGKDPKNASQSFQIPVCFCGIHNPLRKASLRGLYSGGKYISNDGVMTIPAFRLNRKKGAEASTAAAEGGQ